MPNLRQALRVALFAAVILYFAAPLVLAGSRSARCSRAGVPSCLVKKSAMAIKDASIEVAGWQRSGEAIATRLSLNVVLEATRLLDRLGALTVTFIDSPSEVGSDRRR